VLEDYKQEQEQGLQEVQVEPEAGSSVAASNSLTGSRTPTTANLEMEFPL
jgi:hypothetical protein